MINKQFQNYAVMDQIMCIFEDHKGISTKLLEYVVKGFSDKRRQDGFFVNISSNLNKIIFKAKKCKRGQNMCIKMMKIEDLCENFL